MPICTSISCTAPLCLCFNFRCSFLASSSPVRHVVRLDFIIVDIGPVFFKLWVVLEHLFKSFCCLPRDGPPFPGQPSGSTASTPALASPSRAVAAVAAAAVLELQCLLLLPAFLDRFFQRILPRLRFVHQGSDLVGRLCSFLHIQEFHLPAFTCQSV